MDIQEIVHLYFPKRNIISIDRPKGGISADMTIVELQNDNGSEKIVIRQTETAGSEFMLLNILKTAGVASPLPLFLDESCTHLPGPFLILTHIDGQVNYQPDNQAETGAEIGRQLAKIHAVQTNRFDLSFLPYSNSDLPESTGHPLKEQIYKVLKPAWPIMRDNQSPSLLHGDFWPGNLIWQGSNLAGIIDWEDAKLGDPLQDLAISRFDNLFIFGRQAMEALTQSYFKHRAIDPAQLPYWDLYAALRAIPGIPTWAAGWPELGRADLTEAAIWESLNWFIKQSQAKI